MAAWESWIRRYSGHAASDRETVLFYHVKQSISYGPFGHAHVAGPFGRLSKEWTSIDGRLNIMEYYGM